MAWARDNLPLQLLPDRVAVLAQLPRGAAGKVGVGVLRRIVTGELAQGILQRLSVKRYCHHKPRQPESIETLFQAAIERGKPLSFFMMWGCGARRAIGQADRLALKRLEDLMAEAKALPWLSTSLTLMMTDIHATLNGFASDHRNDYFSAVAALATAAGFHVTYESEVWQNHGLTIDEVRAFEETPTFEARWAEFPLKSRFREQASKHSKEGPEKGARLYCASCWVEGAAVAKEYADHVMFTYNGPEFDECTPSLPKLYILPFRTGLTDKPWFMAEDAAVHGSTDG
jgi:hypothetical protein